MSVRAINYIGDQLMRIFVSEIDGNLFVDLKMNDDKFMKFKELQRYTAKNVNASDPNEAYDTVMYSMDELKFMYKNGAIIYMYQLKDAVEDTKSQLFKLEGYDY